MSSTDDSVRVAVRIRPLVKSETDKGCQSVIDKVSGQPQIIVNKNDPFTFNYVFGSSDTQESLYDLAVNNMLEKLFKGYNITILAYGQTGSGKTHTMGTAFTGNFDLDMGVIPRAMHDIFERINKESSEDTEFKITCSFMELYQEQLYDLLSSASREQSCVDIREDKGGIIIPGLTEIKVQTALETTNCLMKGSAGRAVGATAMNQQSSRSHAIFTVTITMLNSSNLSTTSKFHLVDLAGSERSKKTKATGDRFKEGVKINQGLLALGNVISALGGSGSSGYVSYRDSKLTRLLQDSLGGNSITLMIACVSPADYNVEETLSTLRYADRAKKIKNKPIVNQNPDAAEISRLNGIIQKLRMELINKSSTASVNCVSTTEARIVAVQDIETLKKMRQMQLQLQSALHDNAENEMRASVAESSLDKLDKEIQSVITQILSEFKDNIYPTEQQYKEKIESIKKYISEMNTMLEENKQEMLSQKNSFSISMNTSMNDSDVHTEDEQKKMDAFTNKQMDFNNELRRINRELTLKEELHQKVAINLSKFCSFEITETESNLKESETIKILEEEKSELIEKLKHVKESANAKLSEERRKRLQLLELELSKLKQKNLQQSKILKVREKDSQKIDNLNKEIQTMKATKVKLIRAMKAENDSFRQWKLSREKQMNQLKEKDRKRQNEMVRMESMHNKQRNVFKRKVEEAMAVNKRLKTALEKQKAAQMQRSKNGATGKVDQVVSWVDHELEVIMSVIDAEFSLKQLMEDRGVISSRLKEIQETDPNNKKELTSVEEELEMRNAQINDLQQKVISTDIESKMKSICDSIQSMPEARAALKHLFQTVMEMHREYAPKDSKIEEVKNACELADDKIESLEKELDWKNCQHKEHLSTIEKNYEEKIAILLREIHSAPKVENGESAEWVKTHQETIQKLEMVRSELDEYKLKFTDLQESSKFKKPTNYNIKQIKTENLELLDSDISDEDEDEDFLDNTTRDPDWRKTPNANVRKSGNTSRGSKSSIHFNISSDIPNGGIKRTSDGHKIKCACKSGCSTKRCSCRHSERNCSTNCKCSENCCNNAFSANSESDSSVEEEKENDTNLANLKVDPISEIQDEHTPKKAKVSLNTDNKFNITGVLSTPQYPYATKKKKPFFEKLKN